jgi:electron transfer flavoprotein alpha subunit
MDLAVLIKQIPSFDSFQSDGRNRLLRAGVPLEMNPFCRRALSQGVDLVQRRGGRCVAITMGPPSAEEVLREALACGADEAVLLSDPQLAGSDTLVTARALSIALRRLGPFDAVLVGQYSVDATTGQVGPQVAEFLDLPFVGAIRELELSEARDSGSAVCLLEDGAVRAAFTLPAVLSCAERLCAPAKADKESVAKIDVARVRRLSVDDLGPGEWGALGSPTVVGDVRGLEVRRERQLWGGDLEEQVTAAVAAIADKGLLSPAPARRAAPLGSCREAGRGPRVAVLVEPDEPSIRRGLLGLAHGLATSVSGFVTALTFAAEATLELSAAGADDAATFLGAAAPEAAAAAAADWADRRQPWAVLAPSTAWGREVAARLSVRLEAGLIGDVVDVTQQDGRLVGWKPAFGGMQLAAITAKSAVQIVTVRSGSVALSELRTGQAIPVESAVVTARGRVEYSGRVRDDDPDRLARAHAVVGVGAGVHPDDYTDLEPLLTQLGAELGATRRVTDQGWLPHSRQIGVTGHAIAPRLYIAIGVSGKLNHMIGVRRAEFVLAINQDPAAPIFEFADAGIIGDWSKALPILVDQVTALNSGQSQEAAS